jgi:hypothetical protein
MSKVNHGQCALVMPLGYKGTVTSAQDRSEEWSIIEAATYHDLPPILGRIGDWAICTDGLYCLIRDYPIATSRLENFDWVEHMSAKGWVNEADFAAALSLTRTLRDLGYVTAPRPSADSTETSACAL